VSCRLSRRQFSRRSGEGYEGVKFVDAARIITVRRVDFHMRTNFWPIFSVTTDNWNDAIMFGGYGQNFIFQQLNFVEVEAAD